MATEVVMPQMGESIAEGTISKWLVKVGDRIERDQPLLEISTDKVDAEIPSPAAGTVLEIRRQAGETVPVNQVIALVGEAGEKPGKEEDSARERTGKEQGEEKGSPGEETSEEKPAAAAVATGGGEGFDFDLVVIGSGPGGYVAAIRAGQLGLRVALVEKDPRVGGTCTLRGCIPTKALLRTAEVLDGARRAGDFGVVVAEARLDFAKAQAFKQGVVDKNSKGIEFLLKKNKVELVRGFGRLSGPQAVAVEVDGAGKPRTLRARHVLVATGSVPREVAAAPTDGTAILNSDQILELERVPASLVVLGAGAVGVEFASLFASFGAAVTLVEMLPRVLPIEDEEVSSELERALKKRGLKVHTGTTLTGVEKTAAGLRVALDKKGKATTVEAELLLVAVGRAPVTAGLGLEELGVRLERGFVEVDGFMRTAAPSVYAIGDVVKSPALAHVASAEGILAVEHLAGREVRALDYDQVPSCTYCEPEVASVGLSEAKARERGFDVVTGKFPFSALGKARILGHTGGFVKVVREKKYDELLGVHIVGPHATDLIAEAGVALRLEATTEEVVRAIHAHPTLAEAVAEAAHAALGHAIHI